MKTSETWNAAAPDTTGQMVKTRDDGEEVVVFEIVEDGNPDGWLQSDITMPVEENR